MNSLPPNPEKESPQAIPSLRPMKASWFALLTAALLLLFANGADTIPMAAWLSPLFLLRFVRNVKPWLGLPSAYAVLAATFAFQFRGMVPIPGMGWWIFLAGYAALLLLPCIADRWMRMRTHGFAANPAFPAAWAGTEYLASLGPFGSWCSAANSQYGNLPLLQALSATGLWGITFLIGLVAAAGSHCWEAGWDSAAARRIAWIITADGRAIDPWHTQMASFRAIEQGVNLVRHTSRGLSAAYDYQGRCLVAMDHYTAVQWNLVAQVPIRGVRTIYSRFGDRFAWLCMAVVAGLGVRRFGRGAPMNGYGGKNRDRGSWLYTVLRRSVAQRMVEA